MQGEFVIICDKYATRKSIFKHIIFHSGDVAMMRSITRPLKHIVKYFDAYWQPPALAHLSTFYHSAQNNKAYFFNIDADDTMFCAAPKRVAQMLKNAMIYAQTQNLSAFSLDMHTSRQKGVWTFGVSFIAHNVDWLKLFSLYTKSAVSAKYTFGTTINIDLVVHYMKAHSYIKAESFYIENSIFLHFPKTHFLISPLIGSVLYYKNGILHTPILEYIYHNPLGRIPIDKNVVRLEDVEGDNDILMQAERLGEFKLRKLHGLSVDSPVFYECEAMYQKLLNEGRILAFP